MFNIRPTFCAEKCCRLNPVRKVTALEMSQGVMYILERTWHAVEVFGAVVNRRVLGLAAVSDAINEVL